MKLWQFDNASTSSESLFVINKLWIRRRKYFCIFYDIWLNRHLNDFTSVPYNIVLLLPFLFLI